MISDNASFSSGQIADARGSPEQTLFFQFYKKRDRRTAENRIKEIEGQGYKAIFLTVDSVVAGNRERDNRAPFELQDIERTARQDGDTSEDSAAVERAINGGIAGALLANDDIDMTWTKVS